MLRVLLQQSRRVALVATTTRRVPGIQLTSGARPFQYNSRRKESTSHNTANSPELTTKHSSDHVELLYNGRSLKLSNIWLRDHCRCDQCFHPSLLQRIISIQNLDLNVQPVNITWLNNKVEIHWSDGHHSKYDLQWLEENSFPGRPAKTERLLWDKATIAEQTIPPVAYNEFMDDDNILKMHLHNLLTYGFAFVVDAPATFDHTVKAAERIGPTMDTFYGKHWQFVGDMARGEMSYTSLPLGAHTDNSYLPVPAGLQLLHCLSHEGEGGENLLVDGYYCAEKLRETNEDSFNMLKTERILHEFFELSTNTNTACLDSLLKTHPVTDDLIWLRYSEKDRAPLTTIPQGKVPDFYRNLVSLSEIIEDPGNEYWFKLKPGTILFMDNWRVLHGRSAFTGKRHMCGTYIAREYWMGRANLFGLV